MKQPAAAFASKLSCRSVLDLSSGLYSTELTLWHHHKHTRRTSTNNTSSTSSTSQPSKLVVKLSNRQHTRVAFDAHVALTRRPSPVLKLSGSPQGIHAASLVIKPRRTTLSTLAGAAAGAAAPAMCAPQQKGAATTTTSSSMPSTQTRSSTGKKSRSNSTSRQDTASGRRVEVVPLSAQAAGSAIATLQPPLQQQQQQGLVSFALANSTQPAPLLSTISTISTQAGRRHVDGFERLQQQPPQLQPPSHQQQPQQQEPRSLQRLLALGVAASSHQNRGASSLAHQHGAGSSSGRRGDGAGSLCSSSTSSSGASAGSGSFMLCELGWNWKVGGPVVSLTKHFAAADGGNNTGGGGVGRGGIGSSDNNSSSSSSYPISVHGQQERVSQTTIAAAASAPATRPFQVLQLKASFDPKPRTYSLTLAGGGSSLGAWSIAVVLPTANQQHQHSSSRGLLEVLLPRVWQRGCRPKITVSVSPELASFGC